MAKPNENKNEFFDVYEDEDGNEFILVDGEYVPFNPSEYELAEDGEDEADDVIESEELSAEDEEVEVFEVFEDEEGEYILVDGKRVSFDSREYEVVEVSGIDEDDEPYNPFMYDNVQAATDVANDIARSGVGIAREGAALAGEMKEAMDDIKSMLDFKSLLK